MQPFCEEEKFSVNYEHVILVADASEGLCKYYAHVLKRIEHIDVRQKVGHTVVAEETTTACLPKTLDASCL